ncbi:MAG: hypothetical protein C4334_01320 [Pyrinomonas sp.]
MHKFYVMRGPQGQIETVRVGGRTMIAVWPDMLSALRYKTRHPELMSFWTVPLDRRLYEEKFLDAGGGRARFFLMSSANPGQEIERGRVLDASEIEAELYPEIGRRALERMRAGARSAA